MKVDALNRYSFNIYYSSINGKKVLKKSENINKSDDKKIDSFKIYKSNGNKSNEFNEFENKGIYLDLYI